MIVRVLAPCIVAATIASSNPARAQHTPAPAARAAAADQLAVLDARQPVPLLPRMADHQKENMRDHLLAVQEIVGALAARDFAAVTRSASRIGSSPQAEQMCAHMGAGAAGFSERGLRFHRTADRIAEAAGRRDLDATLVALSETLQTCNACHATFRQDVVDEATWDAATKPGLETHPSPRHP